MIVILTALQREYKAVRRYLTDLRTHHHAAGTLFELGVLASHPNRHVALAVMGEGNAPAATLTERAINEFQPGAVLFVGIAGGLRDWLQLGDVVVATRVYGYHGASSEDDAVRARPRAWDVSHQLEQVARLVDRKDSWRSAINATSGGPSVHFNPIAAGEVRLNSATSELAGQLRDHYNDAVAIEMESAGGALAGHLNLATPTITIRGISDRADGTKDFTDQTGAPQLAADNAAAFAVSFVAELDEAASRPNRAASGGKDRPKSGIITNTVTGQSHVVAQFGVVHGGVRIGSPHSSASPADQLAELTEALFADHRRGLLDETTFNVGMLALDDARSQLSTSAAADPSHRKEILRRLDKVFAHRPELRLMIAQFTFGESGS